MAFSLREVTKTLEGGRVLLDNLSLGFFEGYERWPQRDRESILNANVTTRVIV